MKIALVKSLQKARQSKQAAALVCNVETGDQQLVYAETVDSFALELSTQQLHRVRGLLHQGRSGYLAAADDKLFVRSYLPRYRLVIIGAVHIAQYLAEMASAAGFDIVIIDPRRGFASEQRFSKYQLVCEWPEEALTELGLDSSTALVALSHDPKIDDPGLVAALNSEAFYIGALGSIRSHEKRLDRLADFSEARGRICAPVGLKLGGRAPAEIAVSILAEIIQTRYRPDLGSA